MSRSAPNYSDPDSFAELLERLTKRVGESPARPDTVAISAQGKVKAAGTARRVLTPTRELKALSGRLSEATELSYESALRIHGRGGGTQHGSAAAGSDKLVAALAERAGKPAARVVKPLKADAVEPAEISSAKPRTRRRAAAGAAEKPAAKSRAVRSAAAAHERSGDAGDAVTAAKKRTAVGKAAGGAGKAVRRKPAAAKASARVEAPTFEIERKQTDDGHRNAVISIRLNDAEFDQLRIRAAESGVSVSGYMRSCILEAEHLRFQVKQALSEMRLAMGDAQARPVKAALPAPAASASGTWTQILTRSATFLLGPLLALRHRT